MEQEMIETATEKKGSPLVSVLRQRNFRLLWIGEGISLLGDQFYMIALPWLILKMTGDALAIGGVLAVAGIPRALFMLVGGALTDRFSPRKVMLGSNLLRMVNVILLTVLVMTEVVNLWMLYVLALIFGVVDAFFFPAQSSIVPLVVDKENLQIGNSIIQGTAQLSRFAGPVLAGALIVLLGSGIGTTASEVGYTPEMRGIAFALGFDSITFLISAATLWMITIPEQGDIKEAALKESVWSSIRAGLESVWKDVGLRILFFVISAVNILVNGPILVGIPILADTRFPEGAVAFGTIMSAYGGGNLLGTVLAGALPRPTTKHLGSLLLVIISILGVGVALLGLTSSISFAVLISLAMGTANGYVSILFITWLQSRTPQFMLGRLMSLLMFAAIGLNPISMALSGVFIDLNATATFVGAGSLMTVIVLLAALNPKVREMRLELSESSDLA
jgi:MFS family permease